MWLLAGDKKDAPIEAGTKSHRKKEGTKGYRLDTGGKNTSIREVISAKWGKKHVWIEQGSKGPSKKLGFHGGRGEG